MDELVFMLGTYPASFLCGMVHGIRNQQALDSGQCVERDAVEFYSVGGAIGAAAGIQAAIADPTSPSFITKLEFWVFLLTMYSGSVCFTCDAGEAFGRYLHRNTGIAKRLGNYLYRE